MRNQMTYQDFQQLKNLRPIRANEIVFDVDNRELGFQAINEIGCNLLKAGYNFRIYFSEGQKSPHLHLKDIPHLENLSPKQLKAYKEAMLKKYTPDYALPYVDFSLCTKHLIAQEGKLHFKYQTEKKLLSIWNEENLNFCEPELYKQARGEPAYTSDVKGNGITAQIVRKISIINIARRYGLDVDRNKCFCPFHDDITGGTPSLVFYDNQGRFICFSCQVKGNIIDLIYLLRKNGYKEVKNG